MMTFSNDLPALEEGSFDEWHFEEEPSIFSDDIHAVELVEAAFHLMEDFMEENPTAISEPHFHDLLLDSIKDLFYVQFEDHIMDSDYVEDDLNDVLEAAFHIYVSTFHPERSIRQDEQDKEEEEEEEDEKDEDDEEDDKEEEDHEEDEDDKEADEMEKKKNTVLLKIQALRDIPQPVQRTPEWYQFRWNLITASNAWKAFGTQSTINQLIFEKCQPLKSSFEDVKDVNEIKMVNTNTTLHWGQKYEPLSVMFYEHLYDSKVEDFGCLQHPQYKFVGASPDGIVVASNTGRFGRMLEIKNIVNREITGIPKKEYWVQMQLQMEVCDLDECDFLETKFTEYPTAQSFYDDQQTESKGIIVHFHTKDGSPHYEYMPLSIQRPEEWQTWQETTIQTFEAAPYHFAFLKFIYWKLEKLSCVLVLRNKQWFKNNVGQLQNVWNIIENERVTGFEHRAPMRRMKKDPLPAPSSDDVCFLKVVKL